MPYGKGSYGKAVGRPPKKKTMGKPATKKQKVAKAIKGGATKVIKTIGKGIVKKYKKPVKAIVKAASGAVKGALSRATKPITKKLSKRNLAKPDRGMQLRPSPGPRKGKKLAAPVKKRTSKSPLQKQRRMKRDELT